MDGLGFLGLAIEQRRNAATSGDCEISGPDTTARMTHGSTLCRVATAWVLAHADRLAIDLPPRHGTATD